jgi:hypothetical protein
LTWLVRKDIPADQTQELVFQLLQEVVEPVLQDKLIQLGEPADLDRHGHSQVTHTPVVVAVVELDLVQEDWEVVAQVALVQVLLEQMVL